MSLRKSGIGLQIAGIRAALAQLSSPNHSTLEPLGSTGGDTAYGTGSGDDPCSSHSASCQACTSSQINLHEDSGAGPRTAGLAHPAHAPSQPASDQPSEPFYTNKQLNEVFPKLNVGNHISSQQKKFNAETKREDSRQCGDLPENDCKLNAVDHSRSPTACSRSTRRQGASQSVSKRLLAAEDDHDTEQKSYQYPSKPYVRGVSRPCSLRKQQSHGSADSCKQSTAGARSAHPCEPHVAPQRSSSSSRMTSKHDKSDLDKTSARPRVKSARQLDRNCSTGHGHLSSSASPRHKHRHDGDDEYVQVHLNKEMSWYSSPQEPEHIRGTDYGGIHGQAIYTPKSTTSLMKDCAEGVAVSVEYWREPIANSSSHAQAATKRDGTPDFAFSPATPHERSPQQAFRCEPSFEPSVTSKIGGLGWKQRNVPITETQNASSDCENLEPSAPSRPRLISPPLWAQKPSPYPHAGRNRAEPEAARSKSLASNVKRQRNRMDKCMNCTRSDNMNIAVDSGPQPHPTPHPLPHPSPHPYPNRSPAASTPSSVLASKTSSDHMPPPAPWNEPVHVATHTQEQIISQPREKTPFQTSMPLQESHKMLPGQRSRGSTPPRESTPQSCRIPVPRSSTPPRSMAPLSTTRLRSNTPTRCHPQMHQSCCDPQRGRSISPAHKDLRRPALEAKSPQRRVLPAPPKAAEPVYEAVFQKCAFQTEHGSRDSQGGTASPSCDGELCATRDFVPIPTASGEAPFIKRQSPSSNSVACIDMQQAAWDADQMLKANTSIEPCATGEALSCQLRPGKRQEKPQSILNAGRSIRDGCPRSSSRGHSVSSLEPLPRDGIASNSKKNISAQTPPKTTRQNKKLNEQASSSQSCISSGLPRSTRHAGSITSTTEPTFQKSQDSKGGSSQSQGQFPWDVQQNCVANSSLPADNTPPSAPVYMGFRNSSGDREGYGAMRGPDGAIYTGQWNGGRRDGHGTLFFDGGVFEGQWRKGSAHGEGTVHFKNGDQFKGQYQNNRKCGHGTYRWADGAEETGEYKQGQKQGWHQWKHKDDLWELLYQQGAVVAARKASGISGQPAPAMFGMNGDSAAVSCSSEKVTHMKKSSCGARVASEPCSRQTKPHRLLHATPSVEVRFNLADLSPAKGAKDDATAPTEGTTTPGSEGISAASPVRGHGPSSRSRSPSPCSASDTSEY